MVDPKAGKFINSLVKSLQMLCHGYMDFKDNIEIIGHIYLRIDNSQKFDYIVNEQVSRQGDDSTFFQSNSYHSQPPAKAVREKDRPASENIDDDAVTNHIRLDDAAVSGSRVQIDLSGPVPVTRHSELSPGRRFSTSSNASDADHHTSYGRDSHRHSFDEEAAKTLSPEDHPHNHSSLSSARDRDVCERPASSSSERTEINTIFQVKVAEKSRQHESDGLHEFDGTVIVKAEPDEGNHDCVMEEEGTQNQGREMQRIPSVASVLPPAHQSALVANSAHAGHAMFAATLGHSGMFDTSMPTQDSNLSAKTVRQGYVHEAFMQQILSAQQQTHLAHAGSGLQSFPATVQSSKNSTGDFLLPKSAHIQGSNYKASTSPLPTSAIPHQPSSPLASSFMVPQPREFINKRGRRGRGSLALSTNKRFFRCSYCPYASLRRYNLERHIRLRHPAYSLQCPLQECQQSFVDELELRNHMHSHSDNACLFRCTSCSLSCDSHDSLFRHQDTCIAFQGVRALEGITGLRELTGQNKEENDEGVDVIEEDGEEGEDEKGDESGSVRQEHVIEGEDESERDDDVLEIVDCGDNLPVHFLKQETSGDEDSS